MPLEISEIAVRLSVGSPAGGTSAPSAKGGENAPAQAAQPSPQQIDDLVRTCVQEVLNALRMIEGR